MIGSNQKGSAISFVISTATILAFIFLCPSPQDLCAQSDLQPQTFQAAQPITIAAIFAKTGIAMHTNSRFFTGVQLAADEINKSGGILNRPVKIIEIDNKSKLLMSENAARKAVDIGVSAVIGSSWSSHSLAMAPILQEAGIPMLSPQSTNPKVTKIGDYIFRICYIDTFQGKVMAEFARNDLKAITAVMLINVSSHYSIGLAKFFAKTFSEKGGEVLWSGKYKEKAVQFDKILNKVKKLEPDVIFVPGYTHDSGLIIRQARKMGINSIFLGGDGWEDNVHKFGKKSVAGSYFCTHWDKNVLYPKSRKFVQLYKKTYGGKVPSVNIATAYDATMVMAEAICQAGSTDGEAIKNAISKIRDFKGVTGNISFNENGDQVGRSAVIIKLTETGKKFIKSVLPVSHFVN